MEPETRLRQLRNDITRISVQHEEYTKRLDSTRTQLQGLDVDIEELSMALKVLQTFSQQLQTQLQDEVSRFVSWGLRTIWGDEKNFTLNFQLANNQIAAEMLLNDLPFKASQSGGVLDAVSYLLRLWTVIKCNQLGIVDKVLLLDEPFPQLSSGRLQSRMADLLAKLSKEFEVQCLFITHSPQLAKTADRVYQVDKVDGDAVFRLADRNYIQGIA